MLLDSMEKQGGPNGPSFRLDIPDSWRQGRTTYGGLTAGLALSAAQRAFPDLPPLRSVSINFIGPVTGAPILTPILLRRGRNVTSIEVRVNVEDAVVATSTFVFGLSRESHLDVPAPAPQAMPPEDAPPFVPPELAAGVPAFVRNFDTKLVAGGRPTAGTEGYIRAWSRHLNEASRDGVASFLAIGDILPPAVMPLFKQFGPISSVNWMVNFINDPVTEDGWWHVDTSLTAARDGYSSQVMRFWNSKGDLVADGMQCVAIFV